MKVIQIKIMKFIFCLICIKKLDKSIYCVIFTGNMELNGLEVKTFKFIELNIATENFKSANKLGQGAFGVVYKVILFFHEY